MDILIGVTSHVSLESFAEQADCWTRLTLGFPCHMHSCEWTLPNSWKLPVLMSNESKRITLEYSG